MIDFTWHSGLRASIEVGTDLSSASDADDRKTFFDVLFLSDSNFQSAGPSSIPPLPVPRPHQRSPPVPDQTETLRRKYRGPVRQKTHNQYVWVTVCCWSAQISGFLPISLSVFPPARSFPYFWFVIIKKQLMFVINIMQMGRGMRGRNITMMDDWCWQLQLKTGIFITFNNGITMFCAPTLSLSRRCQGER